MSEPNPAGRALRSLRPIFRMIGVRLLIYAGLLLIAAFALFDVSSLGPAAPAIVKGEDSTAGDTAASDVGWPNYRGPNHDGRSAETELADAWPAAGPPLLWNREIGAGYSGLIARAGRAYTQTQSLFEQKILALDPDTGLTIWERRYAGSFQPAGMYPGPRSTAAIANGRIYYSAPNGMVGCLDAADGREIWSLNIVEKFSGEGASFGFAASPVVEGGKVIFPVGGQGASVVALDAETGATVWSSGDGPASYSTVLPISFQNRPLIVALLKNSLAGFDLATGRLLWHEEYSRGYDEHAAAPIYVEPHLRIMQPYRAGSDLYLIKTDTPADGVPGYRLSLLRRDTEMSNDICSSVLVDGFVYGFDVTEMQASRGRPTRGTFRCMDFKTGEIRWSSDEPGQSAILAADGKLYLINDSGQLLLLRANPDRYEELARVEVFPGETCWSAPSLYRGRLFVRSPMRAACYFVGKTEQMTPRQRSIAAAAGAAPKSTRIDLSWLMRGEREYPFELPDLRELMRWYRFSLAAFAAAALVAGFVHGIARIWASGSGVPPLAVPQSRESSATLPGVIALWSGLILFGIAATPISNRLAGPFIFTWPLALITAQQIALTAVLRPKGNKSDWPGLAGAAVLIVGCIFYFKLTRQFSLAPAWYFLAALPAAWPVAIPAARRCFRCGLLADIIWMWLIFSVYYWASGSIMLARTAWGGGEVH